MNRFKMLLIGAALITVGAAAKIAQNIVGLMTMTGAGTRAGTSIAGTAMTGDSSATGAIGVSIAIGMNADSSLMVTTGVSSTGTTADFSSASAASSTATTGRGTATGGAAVTDDSLFISGFDSRS